MCLAEIITRGKKKLESTETAELMLQMKLKLRKKMVRREKRENEDRKKRGDAQMSWVLRKVISKMSAGCSPARSPVQKGRAMILTAGHTIFSYLR